jgi:hypothetical protein
VTLVTVVINVKAITEAINAQVIFVSQKESHTPMTHATPSPTQLPTPVKMQLLISLLSGY